MPSPPAPRTGAVTFVAGLMPLAAIAVALVALRMQRRSDLVAVAACPEAAE
jgi:DHA1 family inner membrane transport protein